MEYIGGLFCGINATLHSIVGELSDATNASTAFPLYDICSALGLIIGCAQHRGFSYYRTDIAAVE
jgi:hypothetical protein